MLLRAKIGLPRDGLDVLDLAVRADRELDDGLAALESLTQRLRGEGDFAHRLGVRGAGNAGGGDGGRRSGGAGGASTGAASARWSLGAGGGVGVVAVMVGAGGGLAIWISGGGMNGGGGASSLGGGGTTISGGGGGFLISSMTLVSIGARTTSTTFLASPVTKA